MTNVEMLRATAPTYLATVYTKFYRGWAGAYLEACRLSSRVYRKHGIISFSPIAHGHGMTTHGDLPVIDAAFWKAFNAPFVDMCGGCIVAKMDGWQESKGARGDIAAFKREAKQKYGPMALWPRDVLIKYEWLKECAVELQDRLLSNEELAV